jgi:hypothetical protein
MIEDQSSVRRLLSELQRHWRWGREQGFGRVIEEAELDPWARWRGSLASWQWRRRHQLPPGTARPVFLVGVQRSGTNMIVRGVETSPEVKVYNENDRRAFERYRIRDDDIIRSIVLQSRYQLVLFKPLCDSHRVVDLLDGLHVPTRPRAIWAYRAVDGRVRSAVAKFGDANRRVLAEIAEGVGLWRWQAQGLSSESLELISSYNYDQLTAESASALFWYVRNSLFFEQGLDRRDDVLLTSYEGFIRDPDTAIHALREFLGLGGGGTFTDKVDTTRQLRGAPRLDIEPSIRRICDELQGRLESL